MTPLRQIWARLVPVTGGKYDVAALIENANSGSGVRRFTYFVRLFDKDGVLLTTRSGESYANPSEQFVLFAGAIDTRQRTAVRAVVDIDTNYIWRQVVSPEIPITIDEQRLETGEAGTVLTARVTNNSLLLLKQLTVSALLSDGEKNVIGASQTVLDDLPRGESKKVIFTWPRVYDPTPTYVDLRARLDQFQLK
jgi:hypothetical protein